MLSRKDNEYITRVGPGTPMGELFRRYWLPALLSEELPEPDCAPIRLRLLGEDLVAFRTTSGRAGVLDTWCPHRNANLFWGRNEEDGLRCVYHGWKFDVDGSLRRHAQRAARSSVFAEKIKQPAYQAVDDGGRDLGLHGPAGRDARDAGARVDARADEQRNVSKRIQACNWLQNLEGEVDSSHVSFLHAQPRARIAADPQRRARRGPHPIFEVLETDYGLAISARRDAGPEQVLLAHHAVHAAVATRSSRRARRLLHLHRRRPESTTRP